MAPSSLVNELFLHKKIGVRIVAGLVSSLSIIGSLVIIFTFCIFKRLRRTNARQILVHISLMDLGVALANLIGTIVYFDDYYYTYNQGNGIIKWKNVSSSVDSLCKTQAFVALYSTYGSIFWTNWLAVYLYFTIVHHHYQAKLNKAILLFGYGICYLLPLVLCVWLLMTHRMGFSPFGSAGWCTLVNIDIKSSSANLNISVTEQDNSKNYFATSFGYDLWIYLTFILIPVLFIGTRAHISIELATTTDKVSKAKLWSAVHNVDYKFILIPLAFIFLRIWTCLVAIILVYSQHNAAPNWFMALLIYLAAIGDSGQGAANVIIFVLCTKKVRERLLSWLYQLCCMEPCKKRPRTENSSLNDPKSENRFYSSVTVAPPSMHTVVKNN